MSSTDRQSLKPLVYLTRIEKFCSAHRLNSRALDVQTNSQTYGKCNAVHGHNYTAEITLKGTVDAITGMVLDIAVLNEIIAQTVMKSLDHKNIDEDVPYFRDNDIVSTAENISVYIWKVIAERLPPNVTLDSIKLHETDKNVFVFRGEYA
ncbi:unnamed protein product [Medioppia subpectinata]|uniref:6-pyruvoyltetrahydropterin synthase n=1 Tax=Medioppia subpectinata TaxID=1979941 RepID=A0A7R9PYE5_9ACAR|nr:unnamed protein product [Medioppia subpectinata]CAG2105320.1 unnamed protein product [Medioppia subpectinata]